MPATPRPPTSSRRAIPPALAGTDLMVAAAPAAARPRRSSCRRCNRVLAARADTTKRRDKGTVYGPRILVLTPTRELAMQIAKAAATYGRHVPGLRVATVVGGVPYPAQLKALRGPLDILISTPGRLLDHLQTGKAVLENVEMLVLDEADRMLDMGFIDDITTIADHVPSGAPDGDVQRHLRSATSAASPRTCCASRSASTSRRTPTPTPTSSSACTGPTTSPTRTRCSTTS